MILFIILFVCFVVLPATVSDIATNSPASDAGFILPDVETSKSISLTLFARIIHAINDMSVYPEGATYRPEPFLYWEDARTAATALIKRYVFVIVACVYFEPGQFLYSPKCYPRRYQTHTSL